MDPNDKFFVSLAGALLGFNIGVLTCIFVAAAILPNGTFFWPPIQQAPICGAAEPRV